MDTSDLPDRIEESPAVYAPDTDVDLDRCYHSLNDRQRRFIDLLLMNGGNQTQAYMAAGYVSNPEHAKVGASILLADFNVRAVYEAKKAELSAKAGISLDRIASELNTHALHDPAPLYDAQGHLKPIHEWPIDLRRCVQEITYIPAYEKTDVRGNRTRTEAHYKLKFVNRQTALELLGRYRGMFKENNIVDNRQIVFNLSVEQDNRSIHYNKDAIGGLILDAERTEDPQ